RAPSVGAACWSEGFSLICGLRRRVRHYYQFRDVEMADVRIVFAPQVVRQCRALGDFSSILRATGPTRATMQMSAADGARTTISWFPNTRSGFKIRPRMSRHLHGERA